MHPVVEYLKSPELVVKVQEYFGIVYRRNAKKECPLVNGKTAYGQNGTNGNEKRLSNGFTVNHTGHRKIDDGDSAYRVTNYFWYVLFIVGSKVGDEKFYATFIPFWIWNIDSAVGRRVVMVWSAIMYVGQGLKDVIRWPRPTYPAARLQKELDMEYGMPSMHAMVSVAIPFSVLIYTYDRYIYSLPVGMAIALVWCVVICVSRVYLGMHSVLDILAGLLLVITLMVPLIPIVDKLETVIVTSRWSPLYVLFITIFLMVFYFSSENWTPVRGSTMLTVGVCAGIEIGAWLHIYLSGFSPSSFQLPARYDIIWPSYSTLMPLLLRTVLGLCCISASCAFAKSSSYAFMHLLLGHGANELCSSEKTYQSKNKIIIELSYKMVTYGVIGFGTQYLLPSAFKLLNIGRPDFYTEL